MRNLLFAGLMLGASFAGGYVAQFTAPVAEAQGTAAPTLCQWFSDGTTTNCPGLWMGGQQSGSVLGVD